MINDTIIRNDNYIWFTFRKSLKIYNRFIFARLRRVPAVWCSKYNPFIWHQLNIKQSAKKSPIKDLCQLSNPHFDMIYDRRFGMMAKMTFLFKGGAGDWSSCAADFCPVEKSCVIYLPNKRWLFIFSPSLRLSVVERIFLDKCTVTAHSFSALTATAKNIKERYQWMKIQNRMTL